MYTFACKLMFLLKAASLNTEVDDKSPRESLQVDKTQLTE